MFSQKYPTIQTARTQITLLQPQQATLRRRFFLENKQHLAPWEPEKSPQAQEISYWIQYLKNAEQQFLREVCVPFTALSPDAGEIIAVCNFNNIVRGAFQACHLGYSVAKKYQGQGLMFEVTKACIDYIFQERQLHRIMANYMPHNTRSGKLLERLGFEREGYAKSYLKIAGAWQDHVLTSLINPAQQHLENNSATHSAS